MQTRSDFMLVPPPPPASSGARFRVPLLQALLAAVLTLSPQSATAAATCPCQRDGYRRVESTTTCGPNGEAIGVKTPVELLHCGEIVTNGMVTVCRYAPTEQRLITSSGGDDKDVLVNLADPCDKCAFDVPSWTSWGDPGGIGISAVGREFEFSAAQTGTFPVKFVSAEGLHSCNVGSERREASVAVRVVDDCDLWVGRTSAYGLMNFPPYFASCGFDSEGVADDWGPFPCEQTDCQGDFSVECDAGGFMYRLNGKLVGRCVYTNGLNALYVRYRRSWCEKAKVKSVIHVNIDPVASGGKYLHKVMTTDFEAGGQTKTRYYLCTSIQVDPELVVECERKTSSTQENPA